MNTIADIAGVYSAGDILRAITVMKEDARKDRDGTPMGREAYERAEARYDMLDDVLTSLATEGTLDGYIKRYDEAEDAAADEAELFPGTLNALTRLTSLPIR